MATLPQRQPVTLRGAVSADVDQLDRLEELVFGGQAVRISRRQWRYLATRAGNRTLIAECDGELAGALVLTGRTGGRVLRIYSIAVHPSARRRGIARQFLDEAERQARHGGFAALHLEVARDNQAAIALYRAAGYETLEVLRGYYGDGEDGLRMEKRIRDRH